MDTIKIGVSAHVNLRYFSNIFCGKRQSNKPPIYFLKHVFEQTMNYCHVHPLISVIVDACKNYQSQLRSDIE